MSSGAPNPWGSTLNDEVASTLAVAKNIWALFPQAQVDEHLLDLTTVGFVRSFFFTSVPGPPSPPCLLAQRSLFGGY